MTQSLSKNNSLSSAECSVHSPPLVSDNMVVTRGSRGLRAGNQFDDIICNLHGHITSVTTITLHHPAPHPLLFNRLHVRQESYYSHY